jgi:hypothetical protein
MSVLIHMDQTKAMQEQMAQQPGAAMPPGFMNLSITHISAGHGWRGSRSTRCADK